MTDPYGLDVARVEALLEVLSDAQGLGFLGRGPVERHLEHGLGFVAAWREVNPNLRPVRIADLGSGGGVPGLVVAEAVDAELVLIDAKTKRTDWLSEAARRLHLDDRVTVINSPAEEVGQQAERRQGFDVVVARSFAGPAPTAECAAGLIRRGGLVVVSEPPKATGRWDELVSSPLGYDGVRLIDRPEGHYAVLQAGTADLPDRIPRTWAAQKKRPLFGG
ncbi:MAG: class I SAM-dependent methyltransferase [Microthrixaceae bacterium]|nr:class I SAM-dependent methyltransferase [Microthrixaceae bacterium]